MKYIFSIILSLVYSLPMHAQSFAPPMYLPEMKIGHLRSEQALETALKKSYSTSLILMDERKMGYFVLGFQGDRVYLYKGQTQIGELNGYSFTKLDSHFEAIEKEFKSRGIFKRSRSFLLSSLVTYLGNSLLLGSFNEIGSVFIALVVGTVLQIHNSAEEKEVFKSLLEIRNSLLELKGSPASSVYREEVVGLGEAMAKLQSYHHRVRNGCKNSASI